MVNWALAQTPDFLSAFNTGYDRGRTQAHDRGVQDALAQLDTNPQGAESALLRYGEVGAATNLRTQRQAGDRQARDQDIYSRAMSGDLAGARAAAAATGDPELLSAIDKLEQQEQGRGTASAGQVYGILTGIRAKPEAERAAVGAHILDQLSPYLPAEAQDQLRAQLANMDWTDQGLDTYLANLRAVLPQERGTVGAGVTAGTWAGNVFTPQYTAPAAPQRPLVLGPNATALDPVTGQPIFRAPPAPARPSSGGGRGGRSSAPAPSGGGTWRVTGVRP